MLKLYLGRVFENKILDMLYIWAKRVEITGEYKKVTQF